MSSFIDAAGISTGKYSTVVINTAVINNLTVNGSETITGNISATGTITAGAGLISDTWTGKTLNSDMVIVPHGTGNVDINGPAIFTNTNAGLAYPITVNGTNQDTNSNIMIINDYTATPRWSVNISPAINNYELEFRQYVGQTPIIGISYTPTAHMHVYGDLAVDTTVIASGATDSTTTATGTIVAPNGGLGIGLNAHIGQSLTVGNLGTFAGILTANSTTDSGGFLGTGSFVCSGGANIYKNAYINGELFVNTATSSSVIYTDTINGNTPAGILNINGGLTNGKVQITCGGGSYNIQCGSTFNNLGGINTFVGTADAAAGYGGASISTAGGVYITKSATVNANLQVNGTAAVTGTTTLGVVNATTSLTVPTISLDSLTAKSTTYITMPDAKCTGTFYANVLTTYGINTDMQLSGNGTGTVNIKDTCKIDGTATLLADISVAGNATVTGDLTYKYYIGEYNGAVGGQSIATGTTTSIPWSVAVRQTNFSSSNFNVGLDQFTPPKAGYYQISYMVNWQTISGAGDREVWIYVNATDRYARSQVVPVSSTQTLQSGFDIIYFNGSTDYFQICVFQSSGGSLTIGGSGVSKNRMLVSYLHP